MGCVHRNGKTYRSIDFTTICPRLRAGKPCSYCYVEAGRKARHRAKLSTEYTPYAGELRRMPPAAITRLNELGGIRLFSYADYMPEHWHDVQRALDDAAQVSLDVKAITKSTAFVRRFHAHPALKIVHLSIDATGDSPVSWRTAREYRRKYGVLIRATITKPAQVPLLAFADILTFNHAIIAGCTLFSRAQVLQYAEQHPGKVCCTTGSCTTCPVKCGRR